MLDALSGTVKVGDSVCYTSQQVRLRGQLSRSHSRINNEAQMHMISLGLVAQRQAAIVTQHRSSKSCVLQAPPFAQTAV